MMIVVSNGSIGREKSVDPCFFPSSSSFPSFLLTIENNDNDNDSACSKAIGGGDERVVSI